MRLHISVMVLVVFLSIPPLCQAADEYTLHDLYGLALKRAERIKLAEENVVMATIERNKAIAGTLPGLSSFGNYTRYSREKYNEYEYLLQPRYTSSWGLKAEQQFSLSMREFMNVSMARKGIHKARYELSATQEEYLAQVAALYYEILKAQKDLSIAQANLDRLTAYRDAAIKRVQAGDTARIILLRAESERAGAETERIKAQDALARYRVELSSMVEVSPTATLRAESQQADLSLDLDKLKEDAMQTRADLKSLDFQRRIAKQKVWFMRGAYLPNLSISGVYQSAHQNPSEEDTLKGESLYGTLGVSFPLFEGGMTYAGVAEAKSSYRQAELQYEELRKNILKEVESAAIEVSTQKNIMTTLTTQLSYARDNYNAVQRQFQLGLASSLDVIDANTQLVSTEQKLAWTAFTRELAIIKLKKATGTFLEEVIGASSSES